MASVRRYYLTMPTDKPRHARNAILYAVAGLPPAVVGCGLVLGFLNPAELRGNHQRIVHSEASAEVSLHAYLTTDNA